MSAACGLSKYMSSKFHLHCSQQSTCSWICKQGLLIYLLCLFVQHKIKIIQLSEPWARES